MIFVCEFENEKTLLLLDDHENEKVTVVIDMFAF